MAKSITLLFSGAGLVSASLTPYPKRPASPFARCPFHQPVHHPKATKHLQVTIDKLSGCAIMVIEFVAANSPRPPGSPSSSFKIIPPREFTCS